MESHIIKHLSKQHTLSVQWRQGPTTEQLHNDSLNHLQTDRLTHWARESFAAWVADSLFTAKWLWINEAEPPQRHLRSLFISKSDTYIGENSLLTGSHKNTSRFYFRPMERNEKNMFRITKTRSPFLNLHWQLSKLYSTLSFTLKNKSNSH